MLGVLRSLRDTIRRYGLTSQLLIQNATIGTNILKVPMSRKFFEGETIVIRNSSIGEIRKIYQITDDVTILLTENLERTWTTTESATVEKAPGGQYIKNIYLGDPDVIPDYPAITITADSRDEEWFTLGSTKVDWKCTISCLFEDDGLENSYENMLEMTKTVENALWNNRLPIFGIYTESNLTFDVAKLATSLTVASTDKMMSRQQGVLEDYAHTQYVDIYIVDGNNITFEPVAAFDYLVSKGAKLIIPSRWTMWSQPGSTTYGYVHKGTLMKASQIAWSANEEVMRLVPKIGSANL